MKIKFIILITIAWVFSGCEKDAEVYQNYLRFELDGVEKQANNLQANQPFNPDNFISISGSFQGGAISLTLNEQDMLIPGTYTFDNESIRSARLELSDGQGSIITYIAGKDGVLAPLQGSGQISITEITPASVKGNFQFITGNVLPGNTFKTVTNGEFQVPRNY